MGFEKGSGVYRGVYSRPAEGMFLPPTYKAMCRQCGDIVQHRLSNDEALRCGNGHFVAPTIARDDLVKPRLPQPPPATHGKAAPAHNPKIIKFRNMSAKAQRRRAITTRNLQARARAIKQQQRDG
jgi:hypothetical protein